MTLTIPYPEHLTVMVGEKTFTPEDYLVLRRDYGKYVVLLLRNADGISACLAVTSIVKVGILGRHMKAVPAKAVAEYLTSGENSLFEPYEEVLVCAPPIDAEKAILLAEVAMSEEHFFETKLPIIASLDAILGCTPERIAYIVDEMKRYLISGSSAFWHRAEEGKLPTGEWNIYTRGGELPQPDRLTNAIKAYANHSVRVYPPLPPVDDGEVNALLRIHDLLFEQGMPLEAGRLITEALRSPMFAHLCHRPDLFAKDRCPPLQVTWPDFGPWLLNNLFSDETSHAARRSRAQSSEPVTLESLYMLTLKEVLALGVPKSPVSLEDAFWRLDTYVGGYLAELDLTHTIITGSAIAATLCATDIEADFGFQYCQCSSNKDLSPSLQRLVYSALPEELTKKCALDAATEALDDAAADAVAEAPDDAAADAVAEAPGDATEAPGDAATEAPGDAAEAPGDAGGWTFCQLRYKSYIDAHYPPTRTVFRDPRDREEYIRLTALIRKHQKNVTIEYETSTADGGAVSLKLTARYHNNVDPPEERTVTLDVLSGADLDMSVVVNTDKEFDDVARGHYDVIRAHYPEAVLKKVTREGSDERYNWSITAPTNPNFRPVEMYRASLNHVATHHVAMVRGGFTGEEPQFIMTASLVISMVNLATPNYYYFASRKTTPQLVVMKYLMRGFSLEGFPRGLQNAIMAFFSEDPLWRPDYYDVIWAPLYPALYGKGYFSAYSIPIELLSWSYSRWGSSLIR